MPHLDKRICIDAPNAEQRIHYTMHHVKYPVLTKGKVYDLIQSRALVKSSILFIDDNSCYHRYEHYDQFFMTLKEFRQSKLNIILE